LRGPTVHYSGHPRPNCNKSLLPEYNFKGVVHLQEDVRKHIGYQTSGGPFHKSFIGFGLNLSLSQILTILISLAECNDGIVIINASQRGVSKKALKFAHHILKTELLTKIFLSWL
jgi:hypothetical protein